MMRAWQRMRCLDWLVFSSRRDNAFFFMCFEVVIRLVRLCATFLVYGRCLGAKLSGKQQHVLFSPARLALLDDVVGRILKRGQAVRLQTALSWPLREGYVRRFGEMERRDCHR